MYETIKISYNDETKQVYITNGLYVMDTSRINHMSMDEWLFPFTIKSKEWKGLYCELCNTYQCGQFSVIYSGTEKTRLLIANYFRAYGIMVSNSVVPITVVCKPDGKVVITVDGKPFDTSRLKNRTIDEWLFPFSVRDIKWAGLSTELENYVGFNGYTIKFVGTPDAIEVFKSNFNNSVNVSYKEFPIASCEKSDSNKKSESNIPTDKNSFAEPQNSVNKEVDIQKHMLNMKSKISGSKWKNIFNKKIVIGCIALLLVICIPVGIMKNKVNFIDKVYRAYYDNSYQAIQKYDNTNVNFICYIRSIDSNLESFIVTSSKEDFNLHNVSCEINDSKVKDKVSKLKLYVEEVMGMPFLTVKVKSLK